MALSRGSSIVAADLKDLRAWNGAASVMPGSHIHSDIEINFVQSGEVEYFFAGQFHSLRENDLAIFWAGVPHALPRVSHDAKMVWVVVPLAWFLQWNLRTDFTEDLLRGQMLVLPKRSVLERGLIERWGEAFGDYRTRDANIQMRHIVALEVEAMLHRAAFGVKQQKPKRAFRNRNRDLAKDSAAFRQIEKLAACISRRYRENLSIHDIAAEVGLHPNYAMQLFRERCGLSLWEYVLRLRVSHAQYLLLATSRKMTDISQESGFASPSRFYAAFEKYCGFAPRTWREEMQRGEPL